MKKNKYKKKFTNGKFGRIPNANKKYGKNTKNNDNNLKKKVFIHCVTSIHIFIKKYIRTKKYKIKLYKPTITHQMGEKKDIDLKNNLFFPTFFSLFAGVIDFLFLAKNNNISNNLKGRLNNHKRTKKILTEQKKLLQEKEKELEALNNQREKLYEKIIDEYNKLPELIQEDEQLKTSIQKIKK